MKRLVLGAVCLAAACDWEHYALVNSIPVKAAEVRYRQMNVYLCLDGLSHQAVATAREMGAFPGFQFSTLIPMFPATSDASWTRLLHAERFEGYEFGYYDPKQDKLVNEGLSGVLIHLLPPFEGSPISPPQSAAPPAYYGAFDIHASGYLDAAWSYDAPKQSFSRALDAIFLTLAGRLGSDDTFTAYLLETDVLGHSENVGEVAGLVTALGVRIQEFTQNHPDFDLRFTLLTDHGLDHTPKPEDHVISLKTLLIDQGVTPVDSFALGAEESGPWAVVVEHTRVTYGAAHTDAAQIDDVAARLSKSEKVDLIVARGRAPNGAPLAAQWTTLWKKGIAVATVGFDPTSDRYWLPSDFDQAALDLSVDFPAGVAWRAFSDEELFAATVGRQYPDLVFRARTSLLPISVEFPADLLISLAEPYLSAGFNFPGAETAGTGGSHGAMGREGSEGALLTTENLQLPSTVRSDGLLQLFPRLKQHLVKRGQKLEDGDQNAGLDYSLVR